jgi:hypothetical protein
MGRVEKPRVVLDGLAFVESARWHQGSFWFAHWRIGEIIATDLDGNREVDGSWTPHHGLVV